MQNSITLSTLLKKNLAKDKFSHHYLFLSATLNLPENGEDLGGSMLDFGSWAPENISAV